MLLRETWDGGLYVLRNGVQIVQSINTLVNQYGYEVVFHYIKIGDDDPLANLLTACKKKNLPFPKARAIAIYNSEYETYPYTAPLIQTSKDGIETACWGADDNLTCKASVRRLLEQMLKIDANDRDKHTVFDYRLPNIQAASKEGYQTFLIGKRSAECLPLDVALERLLKTAEEAKQAAKQAEEQAEEEAIEVNTEYVQTLCNHFLSMDENHPMSIKVKNGTGRKYLSQCFEVSVVPSYLPETDKLQYILTTLKIKTTKKDATLTIPNTQIIKLAPLVRRNFDKSQSPDDKELEKVKILCAQYLGHTWEVRQSSNPYSESLLTCKEKVVHDLYHAETLLEAHTIFARDEALLSKNRTPAILLILEVLAIILSFPLSLPTLAIYSKVTRDSIAFFKPDGQLLAEKLSGHFHYPCPPS